MKVSTKPSHTVFKKSPYPTLSLVNALIIPTTWHNTCTSTDHAHSYGTILAIAQPIPLEGVSGFDPTLRRWPNHCILLDNVAALQSLCSMSCFARVHYKNTRALYNYLTPKVRQWGLSAWNHRRIVIMSNVVTKRCTTTQSTQSNDFAHLALGTTNALVFVRHHTVRQRESVAWTSKVDNDYSHSSTTGW